MDEAKRGERNMPTSFLITRNNLSAWNVDTIQRLEISKMKHQIILMILTFLIVSCATAPTTADNLPPDTVVTSPPEGTMPANESPVNPLAPQPGDTKLTRGNIFIQESGLLIRESFPPQISLSFSGDLPTPCHQVRAVINPPDT
jgi:hypothetical protein